MKNIAKYLILIFLLILVFFLTFMKSPEELSSNLYKIAFETKQFSVLMHALFLLMFCIGLIFKKIRKVMFISILLVLSASALFISFKTRLIPNIFVFGTIFVLTMISVIKKEIDFDIKEVGGLGKIIGFLSILTGFYYLHWVENPIFINALIFSPLGILNCPTLVAICGILVFVKRPGSRILELFAGIITLYFGFFGIMRLGANIDIILIISSIYILSRRISILDNDKFYKNMKL